MTVILYAPDICRVKLSSSGFLHDVELKTTVQFG